MEELKHEQEMRERRNQEREHWRDGRHAEHSAVSDAVNMFHVVGGWIFHLSFFKYIGHVYCM